LKHGDPLLGAKVEKWTGPCEVKGCDQPIKYGRLCASHYRRRRKYGDPLGGSFYADNSGACSVANCAEPAHSRGVCRNHYERLKRYGDPEAGKTSKGEPLGWLLAAVEHAGDECLIW